MLTYLATRRRELLSNVLFLPAVVALAFALLGLAVPALDEAGVEAIAFQGDHAAAHSVLSTIAGSLITVAALSFSLMLVTLQLVSSQFTPRAIRGLLAERAHQLTIGAFVGVFIYCLLVMRLVREEAPVPGISVAVAIAFGVLGLPLLVFFIHHLSQSIKVSNIAARVGRETLAAIDELYPRPWVPPQETSERAFDEVGTGSVRAWRAGYIQRIDAGALVGAAPAAMHVRARPGDFVTRSDVLLSVGRDADPRAVAELERAARRAIHIADERDVEQDAAYGLRLLADIALRALSPGVNDPTTAVTCIHHLGSCLEDLAGRDMPSRELCAGAGDIHIVIERRTFEEHLQVAFEELISFVGGNARVTRELARVLERAGDVAARLGAEDRERSIASFAAAVRPRGEGIGSVDCSSPGGA